MKKILYLSFYFEPDLCAGSFRNSPLVAELARQTKQENLDIKIDVVTTLPNRYATYSIEAPLNEKRDNVEILRIKIPKHNSGFVDQILSFRSYYKAIFKHIKGKQYDLVFASSSRLFTAYIGYLIASKQRIPLYLDIRDIFVDTINDVVKSKIIKVFLLPILKHFESKTFSYASHINLISKGFLPYFSSYPNASYSYVTNGIDTEFIEASKELNVTTNGNSESVKTVIYAGNIGEGQGLHKIIPQIAALVSQKIQFIIIGDGGAKQKLVEKIKELRVTNVQILNPVHRKELISKYASADYLFIHLNDYEAFKKVLPSKVFELGVFNKIILAGVNGYAREFMNENLPQVRLFEPGNVNQLFHILNNNEFYDAEVSNAEFVNRFNRETVNKELAASILSCLVKMDKD